jgi:protein gp37
MVSFGPIIGRIGKVNLSGITTVGTVPEYWGPNPRECREEWIDEIKQQCKEQDVIYSDDRWLCKEKI